MCFRTPGQSEEKAFRWFGNCVLHFAEMCYVVFSACGLSVGLSSLGTMLLNQTKDMRVRHRCSTDGWIHQVLFEASFESQVRGGSESEVGWVKPQFSESGVHLFWSTLLTIATCAHHDLSRRRLEMHRQLWRLLFLFYFTLLLTLSAKNSTVQQETDTIQSIKVIFV